MAVITYPNSWRARSEKSAAVNVNRGYAGRIWSNSRHHNVVGRRPLGCPHGSTAVRMLVRSLVRVAKPVPEMPRET